MADQDAPDRLADRPSQAVVDKAIIEAMRSPCISKRGAVVFNGSVVVARGHNHQVEPLMCTSDAACKQSCRYSAIHAEQAALLRAGRHAQGREMLHVKAVNGVLVPSGVPSCQACSRLIVFAGITRMWLYHDNGWKAYDASEFHRLSGAYETQAHATLTAEVSRLREEIAEAREACPSIRLQDHFDSSLLTLVNREVSRGFNRDAEVMRLAEKIEQLRDENERLKTPRHETFEQWWEAKPALPAQTMDRLEPISDDELKQVELGCMGWLLAESGHAASLRLSRILLRLHKAEQETGDLRAENERLKAERLRPCRFDCVDCGRGVAVDEDGCCVTCGHDTDRVVEAPST